MESRERKIFKDIPEDIDESWHHGAIIGGMSEGVYDRYAIAKAYKLTGDILVNKALADIESYELIYPILYNYRHSIEVYLKTIAAAKNNHDIKTLLAKFEKYVKDNYNIKVPKWFKDRILEFDEFDPRSTAFRYDDVGIRSSKTGDTGEFWIDLPYLKKVMDILQTCFHRIIENKN